MRKKLIEVALPLDVINAEAAREKSIRHGHPSTLHLWWARRPLAACRAVLFASLVDDPDEPEAPEEYLQALDELKDGDSRKDKLFRFIGELVKWENSNDEKILGTARKLIHACTDGNPPPVIDPFCGGGSIPLEAQRLGLEAYASDLNPVAVLITKALVEIPPKFADMPPVNPEAQRKRDMSTWRGAQGLAEDVRYYGQWMRDEAEKRIGHLYPKGPNGETVIAWLWARTVRCPNPACGAQMPLVRSFALSTKKGSERHLEPEVQGDQVRFRVRKGRSGQDRGTVARRGATCLFCGTESPLSELREWVCVDARDRLGAVPLAVVVEGHRGREYLEPFSELPEVPRPDHIDDVPLPEKLTGGAVMAWGFRTFGELFTDRQLVALTTFSDLVGEAREKVLQDAIAMGMADDGAGIEDGGTGPQAYADAVATYLGLMVDRLAMTGNSLVRWNPVGQKAQHCFGRQALPMLWDFAEPNFLASATGSLKAAVKLAADPIAVLPTNAVADVHQLDAAAVLPCKGPVAVSTDPPYYDNIGYADLSDFFYVWLRRSLRHVYPTLFSTMLVPKAPELVATPHRFEGGRDEARDFFEDGLRQVFNNLHEAQADDQVMTVYYAFKQEERDEGEGSASSTGWETMLTSLLGSGFAITGTWPLRTEMPSRQVAMGTNALASSIVLVCRRRPDGAPMATRREFTAALQTELPEALAKLQESNIAPVDLAQASIGPGMGVFSRYSKVLEADGSPVTVRAALQIINQELDRYLAEQEGDFDRDTRFCIDWFTQYGQDEAEFGEADVLARAKNTSVEGLVSAGVLEARRGKVRLLRKDELAEDWDPAADGRMTVWECTHHLIRRLDDGGEAAAAALVAELGGGISESARALAYRLYSICDRKGWADLARDYNNLVVSWPAIRDRAAAGAPAEDRPLL